MLFFKKKSDDRFGKFLEPIQVKEVRRLIRQKKAGSFFEVTNNSFLEKKAYPQLNSLRAEQNIIAYIADMNAIIRARAYESLYYSFSKKAYDALASALAQKEGTQECSLSHAVACQLVSNQPLHILVLTDDPSLREELIMSVKAMSNICEIMDDKSALLVEKKAGQVLLGLLPKAHNGIFIIPDIGKEKRIRSVFSAMDKAMVEYDKKTATMPANISVLAFGEPRGLRFITKSLDILRRQLPCDKLVLSRFHMVFVIEKTNKSWQRMFLTEDDAVFVRGFQELCKKSPVDFPENYSSLVTKFIELAKKDEAHFVVDITEKTAVCIKRLACARAQLFLRESVLEEDVKEAMGVVRDSIYKVG